MVDVFVRQNYTADSNAMMVGFLNEFADAEEAVGNSKYCCNHGLTCPCLVQNFNTNSNQEYCA